MYFVVVNTNVESRSSALPGPALRYAVRGSDVYYPFLHADTEADAEEMADHLQALFDVDESGYVALVTETDPWSVAEHLHLYDVEGLPGFEPARLEAEEDPAPDASDWARTR